MKSSAISLHFKKGKLLMLASINFNILFCFFFPCLFIVAAEIFFSATSVSLSVRPLFCKDLGMYLTVSQDDKALAQC